jgi:hypothetical protein
MASPLGVIQTSTSALQAAPRQQRPFRMWKQPAFRNPSRVLGNGMDLANLANIFER